MSPPLPLVKLSLLRPYVAALQDRGIDPAATFESVGLAAEMTRDPEMTVHVMVVTQFVENAAEATSDPFFAASVAARIKLEGWPMLADAERRASTVGEFLSIFVSTANEHATSAMQYLHLNGPMAVFGEKRAFDPTILPSQNDAFMASLAYSILNRTLGNRMDPSKVSVVVSDPKVLPTEFDLMHPIKGDRKGFSIRFPSAWLSAELNSTVAPKTQDEDKGTDTAPFVSSFRQVIRAHIGKRDLTASDCADLVAMSQQKLKRRLAAFETSISAEIDFVRQEIARRLLETTDQSISEVAAAVGYTDAANFTRAFRRMHDETPSAFRKARASTSEDSD